jgi:hypothetical protein
VFDSEHIEKANVLDRAEEAKKLLDNPLIVEALADIEKMAIAKLSSCDVANHTELVANVLLLRQAKLFDALLTHHINQGEILKHEPEQERLTGWRERLFPFTSRHKRI